MLIHREDSAPFLTRPPSFHLLPGAPAASLSLMGEEKGEEVESFVEKQEPDTTGQEGE